jgi:hypothetical protein
MTFRMPENTDSSFRFPRRPSGLSPEVTISLMLSASVHFYPDDPQRSENFRADLPGDAASLRMDEASSGKQQGDRQETPTIANDTENGFSHPIGSQRDSVRRERRIYPVVRDPPEGMPHIISFFRVSWANRLSHALRAGILDLRAVEVMVHLRLSRSESAAFRPGIDQRHAGTGALRQLPGMPRDSPRALSDDAPRPLFASISAVRSAPVPVRSRNWRLTAMLTAKAKNFGKRIFIRSLQMLACAATFL